MVADFGWVWYGIVFTGCRDLWFLFWVGLLGGCADFLWWGFGAVVWFAVGCAGGEVGFGAVLGAIFPMTFGLVSGASLRVGSGMWCLL